MAECPSGFACIDRSGGLPRIIIEWGELFSSLIKGTVLVVFQGLIAVITGIGEAGTTLFTGLANRIALFISALVGGVVPGIEAAEASAIAQLAGTGIAAFMLAALVVGLTAYILSLGVNAVDA